MYKPPSFEVRVLGRVHMLYRKMPPPPHQTLAPRDDLVVARLPPPHSRTASPGEEGGGGGRLPSPPPPQKAALLSPNLSLPATRPSARTQRLLPTFAPALARSLAGFLARNDDDDGGGPACCSRGLAPSLAADSLRRPVPPDPAMPRHRARPPPHRAM